MGARGVKVTMANLTSSLGGPTFFHMSTSLPANSHGARVRALREQYGITQGELARRSGLGASTICAIEKGRNKATSADAQGALAKGFWLTIEQLRDYLGGRVAADATARNARLT